LEKELLEQFQGSGKDVGEGTGKRRKIVELSDIVLSYEVPMIILERKGDDQTIFDIKTETRRIDGVIQDMFRDILGQAGSGILERKEELRGKNIRDWDCYMEVVKAFHRKCFNLGSNGYALRQIHLLSVLCQAELDRERGQINMEQTIRGRKEEIIMAIYNYCIQ